jgi:hypothetical protein
VQFVVNLRDDRNKALNVNAVLLGICGPSRQTAHDTSNKRVPVMLPNADEKPLVKKKYSTSPAEKLLLENVMVVAV